MLFRILSLLAYGIAFQLAYQLYLAPTFDYASYRNVEMTLSHHLLTLAFVALPSLLFKDRPTPAAFGAALIYVVVYVPGQIMIPRMLDDLYFPTLSIQAALAASMAAISFFSGVGGSRRTAWEPIGRDLTMLVLVLAIPCLMAMAATNYQYMRFVDFASVYELREDSSKAAQLPILAYTNLWLAYCFLPYFITRGILMRERFSFAFGFAGCLMIYLATGAKAQILLPIIMIGINFVSKRVNLSLARLAAISILLVLLCTALPTEGPLGTIKFLYLMRTLSTGGLTMSLYYEFFSSFGYTNYTHINLIGPIIGTYPYGAYSMGQVIGLQYYNSELANYNANFWASDGLGAMGIAGVPIITTILCAILVVMNRLASFFDPRFVSLWLTGFWLAMLNLPLSTAMLSGGGLLTLLLLLTARLQGVAGRARSGAVLLAPRVA